MDAGSSAMGILDIVAAITLVTVTGFKFGFATTIAMLLALKGIISFM